MNDSIEYRCPHCRKPAAWENNPHRPFCSRRCRLIDLGDWAAERYRIADRPAEEEELLEAVAAMHKEPE